MKKKIALVGCSNVIRHRQDSNVYDLMEEIQGKIGAVDMEVEWVQVILTLGSRDRSDPNELATLYSWEGSCVEEEFTGTLSQVQSYARARDVHLAAMIQEGMIDGIVYVSPDPDGVNHAAFTAAAAHRIPVVGTQGEGTEILYAMGCRVVPVQIPEENDLRASMDYCLVALAKEWGIQIPMISRGDGSRNLSLLLWGILK